MHKLNLPSKVQAQYCICIYTCAVAVVLPTWPVKAPLTTLIFKLKALSYQTTNLLFNQAIQPFESAMKTDHPIYTKDFIILLSFLWWPVVAYCSPSWLGVYSLHYAHSIPPDL